MSRRIAYGAELRYAARVALFNGRHVSMVPGKKMRQMRGQKLVQSGLGKLIGRKHRRIDLRERILSPRPKPAGSTTAAMMNASGMAMAATTVTTASATSQRGLWEAEEQAQNQRAHKNRTTSLNRRVHP